MSDALGGSQDMGSVLAVDANFRRDFQQLVSSFPSIYSFLSLSFRGIKCEVRSYEQETGASGRS